MLRCCWRNRTLIPRKRAAASSGIKASGSADGLADTNLAVMRIALRRYDAHNVSGSTENYDRNFF